MMNTQPGASAPTEDTKPSNHPGLTENTETTPIDSERQKKSKNRLSFHPARRMFGSGSVHDLFKETDDVLLAHRMRVEAKKRSITYQVIGVIAFTFVFLTFSTILFVRVADLNVRDALLYVVYTTTSTGFGTVPMPKDEPLFFFYLSFFMYVGLFCTMSLVSKDEGLSPNFICCILSMNLTFNLRRRIFSFLYQCVLLLRKKGRNSLCLLPMERCRHHNNHRTFPHPLRPW